MEMDLKPRRLDLSDHLLSTSTISTPEKLFEESDNYDLHLSIIDDNQARFVNLTSKLFSGKDSAENRNRALQLLGFCCIFDSIGCATWLLNGKTGMTLVNEADSTLGLSPLHIAAEAHSVRCVELLLEKGGRTDARSGDGKALIPLEMCLSSKSMDVIWNPIEDSIENLVVLLSEKDLRVLKLLCDKTKELQEVAYKNAVAGQLIPLAALLIVAAEKVNQAYYEPDYAYSGSEQQTSIYGCVIKEALSLGQSLKAGKQSCMTTLNQSVLNRKLSLRVIELLQLFGAVAQISSKDQKLILLLIRAIKSGDEAVIELLLKTNLDLSSTDTEGYSALHWSLRASVLSRHQQIIIIKLLLQHGARVDQGNKLGFTAFHYAAAKGNAEALRVLLKESPDSVNIKNELQETPIFFAVKNDHVDCARLLLFCGARIDMLNLRRQRPLDLAESQDMRFLLSSTNISPMKRASQAEQKHVLVDRENVSSNESYLPLKMKDEGTTSNRKGAMCKYFESPTGCIRGSTCFYAHGEEELLQTKPGADSAQLPANELNHKVLFRGLPPSIDSVTLGKILGELFGVVKDARVMTFQSANPLPSQGFGYVIFEHEKSVLKAIQTQHINIMGKRVEIRGPMSKSPSLVTLASQGSEEQKTSEKTESEMPITQETKSENMSWVDRLLHGQPKRTSEPQQQSRDVKITPAWLNRFMKWLPSLLSDVSKSEKGAYPLSSLKGDFRTKYGLELDHASLGYQKLSDFMNCFSDVCQMKAVPIGRLGMATHLVLLPSLSKHKRNPLLLLPMPSQPAAIYSAETSDDKSPRKLLVNSPLAASSVSSGTSNDYLIQHDASPSEPTGFTGPYNPESTDVSRGGEVKEQRKHSVLETLATKRNNKSHFFLREFDFHPSYEVSVEQRICFWCNRSKSVWANSPCGHILWCSDCKLHAKRAAGSFEHKCVVCDLKVEQFVFNPPPSRESILADKEFPPIGVSRMQTSLKKCLFSLTDESIRTYM